MRRIEKWMAAALALCLAGMSLPVPAVRAEPEKLVYEKLIYEKKGDHIAIIDCEQDIAGDIVIPDTIEGLPVTEIGRFAFFCEDNITGIHIPATVASLDPEGSIVACPKVAAVTVAEDNPNYRSIFGAVFSKDVKTLIFCPPLEQNPFIPSGVVKIAPRAFYMSQTLRDAYIPDTVTEIGALAFGSCKELVSATVPEGVTVLRDNTFSLCIRMTEITLPASLKQMEHSVFANCIALTDVYYDSTESDWKKIDIHGIDDEFSNSQLRRVTMHYTEPESPPADASLPDMTLDPSHIKGGQVSRVYFGNFAQDSADGAEKEPVKWRTLANSGSRLFLLSDQILSGSQYVPDCSVSFTWEGSALRQWLGGAFLTGAFSPGEQTALADTELENADNLYFQTSAGTGTTDKIFSLSIAEAENADYFPDDESRVAATTAYAAKRFQETVGRPRAWWLRSRGGYTDMTANVLDDGEVNKTGEWANNLRGARPAFHLDLSRILYASAATGVAHTVGVLGRPGKSSDNEWRLTLKDGSRSDFSATGGGQGAAGGSTTVSFSNARSGNGEYVSAIIADGENSVLFYGHIAENSVSGTVSVPIPGDLTPGSYTLRVFSEQYNGDKRTGYGSDFISLPLTVTQDENEAPGGTEPPAEPEKPAETEKPGGSGTSGGTETPDGAEKPSETEKPNGTGISGGSGTSGRTEKPVTVRNPVETEKPAPEEIKLPFCDVAENAWYFKAVQKVFGRGVMTGIEKDRFQPEAAASRGMIVTVLYRLEKEPEVSGGKRFSDIPDRWYYARAVSWAAETGIVAGYGDGSFRPDSAITREMLAALLYRYSRLKGYDVTRKAEPLGFPDENTVSGYAADAVRWAKAMGLMNGTAQGLFDPKGQATRAQVATVLDRFLGIGTDLDS